MEMISCFALRADDDAVDSRETIRFFYVPGAMLRL